jgi:hypothetical protein
MIGEDAPDRRPAQLEALTGEKLSDGVGAGIHSVADQLLS